MLNYSKEDIERAVNELISYLADMEDFLGVILAKEEDIDAVIRNMLAYYEIMRYIHYASVLFKNGDFEDIWTYHAVPVRDVIARHLKKGREAMRKKEAYPLLEKVYFEIYPFNRLIYQIKKAEESANTLEIRKALLDLYYLFSEAWRRWRSDEGEILPTAEIWKDIAIILAYGDRRAHRLLVDAINGALEANVFKEDGSVERRRYILFERLKSILECIYQKALKRQVSKGCLKWVD
jgi:hypothetical protein